MQYKFLKLFPKPLLDDLVAGRWLPIVGAGFSRNAILPPKKQIPLWGELGKLVELELGDFEPLNPIDALSAYEYEYKRPKLVELLSRLLLIDEARPGDAHKAFCQMQFKIVCTTNFDFLLEKQYESTPRVCTPLIDEDQLSVNLSDAGVALLKLHGDLNHPTRLIVTENDYDLFLNKYPLLATYMANLLITRTPILIGYSLDDPDFRQLWQIVGERLGRFRRTAYVITVGAKHTDIVRFERRGIKVINLITNKSNIGEVLSQTFNELYEYWGANSLQPKFIKEEQPLRELSLPPQAPTRLCFFALPISLSPFYREKVFPIIKEYGFVPVTADDVVSQGDTVFSIIDALIRRAQLFIGDISTQNTMTEFQMAMKNIPNSRILIITRNNTHPLPIDMSKLNVITRPDFLSADPEAFLDRIKAWISNAAEQFEPTLATEPQRLLVSGEYRSAIISSITLLESNLRKWLDIPNTVPSKSITLRNMLEQASHQELLGTFDVHTILDWLKIRNEVVHSDKKVTKIVAEQIVNGVHNILNSRNSRL
jgi:hypothetical protein